ncbi:ferritin light chain [Culicoides brevitarsis]|uniref:ferritin light chain n=1 Tax=Culicoides brevitarsis TaxID=469753 RepID=UPI00307BF588
MKLFVFAVVLLSATQIRAEESTAQYCQAKDVLTEGQKRLQCMSSRVAGFEKDNDLGQKLVNYAWDQIAASYDHLLLSVNFDTYTKDRPGFEKLYRGLSDAAWNKALEVIKYVALRGGKPDVSVIQENVSGKTVQASVSELASLKEAVKIEKLLSQHAHNIHNEVQSHHKLEKNQLDAGMAHFVEEELIEQQTENIRKLVGLHNDFQTLLNGEPECISNKNTQLACFLFDEYLQK